jgi:ATP adenylyltransferase
MNKYPYNSGHLLVCPIRHIQNFCQFTETELSEIMKTLQETESIMAEIFNAQGFNIGINIGPSSGAGLPSHLHFHIVPRWNGDFNFMSTIADCKVISESIEQTRLKLIDAFKNKNHI